MESIFDKKIVRCIKKYPVVRTEMRTKPDESPKQHWKAGENRCKKFKDCEAAVTIPAGKEREKPEKTGMWWRKLSLFLL